MPLPIDVTAEPIDDVRCKFILNRPVAESGVHEYVSDAEAEESPVAQAVLAVPGVSEVVLSGNVMTVLKSDTSIPWAALESQVRYAVNVGAAQAEEMGIGQEAKPMDDDAIFNAASEIFKTQINPAVASHGGKIELIDVQDATVLVRLMGGCHGCGMAAVTLRQGVEKALKQAIPGIKGIRDITDHDSGTNPYYA
jgi:Fe-S cluster biogenesis protein NfuA